MDWGYSILHTSEDADEFKRTVFPELTTAKLGSFEKR
jgi:hypothetical protein